MKCDVTIIGAGPSGLTLAKTVASEGYDVLILEEHPEVGLPQHCTGKISVNALKELELEASGVLQKIRGATFYPPNLKALTIKRDENQALILDRKIFDQTLSKRAVEAGAKLLKSSRAKKFSVTPDNVTIFFEQNGKNCEVNSKLVVGADGATSNTARSAGLYSKKISEVRMGVQREVSDIQTVQSVVELYFGRRWAPGFSLGLCQQVVTRLGSAWLCLPIPLSLPLGILMTSWKSIRKHVKNLEDAMFWGEALTLFLRVGLCAGRCLMGF